MSSGAFSGVFSGSVLMYSTPSYSIITHIPVGIPDIAPSAIQSKASTSQPVKTVSKTKKLANHMKKLILYSKPGCHLCEGLQEKLETLPVDLEVRNITLNDAWFQKYQYEVPVLCHPVLQGDDWVEQPLPRLSPRASEQKVAQMIQTYTGPFEA